VIIVILIASSSALISSHLFYLFAAFETNW